MASNPTTSPRETDPLLSGREASSNEANSSSLSPNPHTRCTWPWLSVVILVMLGGTISSMGEDLLAAPKIRLFEATLCSRYYSQNDPSLLNSNDQIPEHLCKIDAVQDDLAAILGGQFFFDSIPAILFPIPYGVLADKYGRKWILVIAYIGFTLSYAWTIVAAGLLNLPLQSVWFSSAFFVLGGGPTVGTYLLTTVVADVVPETSRSTVFFYRFCTDLIADLIIPPFTWYLMDRNIWIPLIGSFIFQAVNCLVCAMIPETAPLLLLSAITEEDSPAQEPVHNITAMKPLNNRQCFNFPKIIPGNSLRFLPQNKLIAFISFIFLISKIGRQSSNVLLQYVSKGYDWSLSQAELLLSLRALVNIILYTVLLPAIAAFILDRVRKTAFRDLLLARGSILLLLVGSVTMFLSSTSIWMITGLILFTLGTGFAHALRGLVTSIMESSNPDDTKSDIASLYAIISVAEGIGSLIAALGMSWTLRLGLSLGRQWLGLPFGLAAVLFGFISVAVFSITKNQIKGL